MATRTGKYSRGTSPVQNIPDKAPPARAVGRDESGYGHMSSGAYITNLAPHTKGTTAEIQEVDKPYVTTQQTDLLSVPPSNQMRKPSQTVTDRANAGNTKL